MPRINYSVVARPAIYKRRMGSLQAWAGPIIH